MDFLLKIEPQHARILRDIIRRFGEHPAGCDYVHRLVKPEMIPYVAAWMIENESKEANESWARICGRWKAVYTETAGSFLRRLRHTIIQFDREGDHNMWSISNQSDLGADGVEGHQILSVGQCVKHERHGIGTVCAVNRSDKCYCILVRVLSLECTATLIASFFTSAV
jgi:hypothetical protein